MSRIIELTPASNISLTIRNKNKVLFEDKNIKGFLERKAIGVGNSAKINIPKQHLPKIPSRVYVVICK